MHEKQSRQPMQHVPWGGELKEGGKTAARRWGPWPPPVSWLPRPCDADARTAAFGRCNAGPRARVAPQAGARVLIVPDNAGMRCSSAVCHCWRCHGNLNFTTGWFRGASARHPRVYQRGAAARQRKAPSLELHPGVVVTEVAAVGRSGGLQVSPGAGFAFQGRGCWGDVLSPEGWTLALSLSLRLGRGCAGGQSSVPHQTGVPLGRSSVWGRTPYQEQALCAFVVCSLQAWCV